MRGVIFKMNKTQQKSTTTATAKTATAKTATAGIRLQAPGATPHKAATIAPKTDAAPKVVAKTTIAPKAAPKAATTPVAAPKTIAPKTATAPKTLLKDGPIAAPKTTAVTAKHRPAGKTASVAAKNGQASKTTKLSNTAVLASLHPAARVYRPGQAPQKTVTITVKSDFDSAIVALLTEKIRRGRKKLLPLDTDVRLGKNMRSVRDLKRMLTETTRELTLVSSSRTSLNLVSQSKQLLASLA